jgi:hypothetical protein
MILLQGVFFLGSHLYVLSRPTQGKTTGFGQVRQGVFSRWNYEGLKRHMANAVTISFQLKAQSVKSRLTIGLRALTDVAVQPSVARR